MIKDIHDVEKVVSAFIRSRFETEHVHVLRVEYDKDVWTAQGGFIAKDCPLAIFTVKVGKEENILSQSIACAIPRTSKPAEHAYG